MLSFPLYIKFLKKKNQLHYTIRKLQKILSIKHKKAVERRSISGKSILFADQYYHFSTKYVYRMKHLHYS